MFWVCEGRVEKPIAVPAATGMRMEAAGLSKMKEGRVREGMYVVIAVVCAYVAT